MICRRAQTHHPLRLDPQELKEAEVKPERFQGPVPETLRLGKPNGARKEPPPPFVLMEAGLGVVIRGIRKGKDGPTGGGKGR